MDNGMYVSRCLIIDITQVKRMIHEFGELSFIFNGFQVGAGVKKNNAFYAKAYLTL